jgi:hypothetical protein
MDREDEASPGLESPFRVADRGGAVPPSPARRCRYGSEGMLTTQGVPDFPLATRRACKPDPQLFARASVPQLDWPKALNRPAQGGGGPPRGSASTLGSMNIFRGALKARSRGAWKHLVRGMRSTGRGPSASEGLVRRGLAVCRVPSALAGFLVRPTLSPLMRFLSQVRL